MVKHEIKVIDVKDNEVLEELNEQRDEEQSNDIINDDTTNEIEEDKKEDIIEPAKTVKEKKTRVKKEKIITDEEVKPAKAKKPRTKKEKEETKPVDIPEPEPIEEVKPEPEPIPVEEVKSKKKQKIFELVTCDKCNREMTAKTLKYSHESICPATNPPKEKVKKIKKEYVQQPIQVVENPSIPLLNCEILSNTLNARRENMNQKKEMYKQLLINAF